MFIQKTLTFILKSNSGVRQVKSLRSPKLICRVHGKKINFKCMFCGFSFTWMSICRKRPWNLYKYKNSFSKRNENRAWSQVNWGPVELSGKTAIISTKPRPPQNYYLFWIDVVTKTRNDLQWSTMTYSDLQWPTMIYNDLQWSTMTYNGLQWATMSC